MPKITLLIDSPLGKTGEILDKPNDWITFNARREGLVWERISSETPISSSEDSAEIAYSKLSDAEKTSIRTGGKKLARRKSGWLLLDVMNESSEEIHISLPQRAADAKDGAKKKAADELLALAGAKEILKISMKSGDVNATTEDYDSWCAFVDKLSLGSSEVDALKVEIERLNRIIKTK